MKLLFSGHEERYAVEQSLLNLFPGEKPVYGPLEEGDESWASVALREEGDRAWAEVELTHGGDSARARCGAVLAGSDFDREGARRRLLGRCFFLAARAVTARTPPWGMLTGVRPDKLALRALEEGRTPAEAARELERRYFVSPARSALAAETALFARRCAGDLAPRDAAVYVGIPFCPTRCAYCSFVSQSVERSFAGVGPYVEALEEEIRLGGETAGRLGLRIRAFYMGGGTPTTLTPEQLHRVLSAFEDSFDRAACGEVTVEAGRPDTITEEKLAVLREHHVTRISVNPQTMEDAVLRAIGRRHTAEDLRRAMETARSFRFPHLNMDLIAGLPEDTPQGFRRSLTELLTMGADNLTVHTLALKKGSRILTQGTAIPSAEAVAQMLDDAGPALREAGYRPYYLYRQKYMSGSFENVGWSLPGAECLYNVYIMSELCSILSFGAGGVTKLTAGSRIERLFNPKYPEEYVARREKRQEHLAAVEAFYGRRE